MGKLDVWRFGLLVRHGRTSAWLHGSLTAHSFTARLVPQIHLCISLGREYGGRQLFWEDVSRLRVPQSPVLDGMLEKGDMFFRPEQNLNRLPSRETPWGKSGDRRRRKVVVGWLKGVLASCYLPDV